MQKAESGNQASLLTPPGSGAIAVVRLKGPGVSLFLQKHFSQKANEYRCIHGTLSDSGQVIDDPVVVLSGDGQIADINLHGGEWVVRECLELARRDGFEICKSTDDLLDAQTVIEREMLIALPTARTELAIRLLLNQPSRWAQFKEDWNKIDKPSLQSRVRAILDDRSLWWLLNPPRIAIIGAPNVGKSTLANQLFGQRRSITADVAGTTRDWVGDWANLDGLPVHLLDTPGQRESTDSIEQAAIARSRDEIDRADLQILLIDPTQATNSQRPMIDHYPVAMIVLNKCDLPLTPSPRTRGDEWGEGLRISALTGTGIDELRQRILGHFAITFEQSSPHWWTDRQRDILTRAMDKPNAVSELFEENGPAVLRTRG